MFRTPEKSSIFGTKTGVPVDVMRVANRARSASLSHLSKLRATPERPPRPLYGLFESPSTERTAFDASSSSPRGYDPTVTVGNSSDQQADLHGQMRSRNDSDASSVRVVPSHVSRNIRDEAASSPPTFPPAQLSSPSERKLSAASSSSIPFVIAIGSPHNPALVPAAASMPPTSCSITRNAPLKISTGTSRAGVGGTMASTTPVTSPVVSTNISSPTNATTIPNAIAPARKISLSRKQGEQIPATPRTPSHSRNASGSSVRTAIRLPKREKESEAQRVRKASIGMPRPLGSPFDIDRAMSVGADRV
jgi:hypothetical protein